MPMFKPDGPDDSTLRATGDRSFDVVTGPRFESAMPAGYVLDRMGIPTESTVAVRTVEAGEVFKTSQSEYVVIQDTRVRSDGATQSYDYTGYDLGGGQIAALDEAPTTPLPTEETAVDRHYNPDADISFTPNSVQTAFGGTLLPEQVGPQEQNVSSGSSFASDPNSATEGIANFVLTVDDEEAQG